MSKTNQNRIYRKNYTPSHYLIRQTNLIFELTEEWVIVKSHIEFYTNEAVVSKNSLFLNGENLELIEVLIDDNLVKYKLVNDGLELFNLPQQFNLKTIVKIYPQHNTSLNGLYKSSGIFCTQCEAHGFRNITYYLDRPDILSSWQVEIFSDSTKYPMMLSNGNLVQKSNNYTKWLDPYPKPCYLFALIAGNLSVNIDKFITSSGKQVTLEIFTEKHNITKTDFAMQSLKNAMRWDEERFGLEYDLDNYMIVAVDDFNMGAMENKGLNIFNSTFILANPVTATDTNYLDIESVIGHEYFHNWTGNRVTCRDWFQLSLKEGLTVFRDQEFSSDLRSRGIKRIEDVDYLRTYQFAEDNSSLKHPVRPDSYLEMNNFYTLTVYEKGAEIVRMLHTIIGEDKFQTAMQLYFERFDGLAVTIEDFVQCMSDASVIDLSRFMLWYSNSATHRITINNNQNQVIITQNDARLLPIKYGVLAKNGDELENGVLLIDKCKQEFDFSYLPKDCIFSWLRDFSAPIIIHENTTLSKSVFLVINDSNEFVRFDNMQKLYQAAIFTENEAVFVVLDALINSSIDYGLMAKLLEVPNEKSLYNLLERIDVEKIHSQRQVFVTKMATRYQHYFQATYQRLMTNYEFNTTAIFQRKLKNICLSYLLESGEFDLAYQQFNLANCMTDKLAAFNLLLIKENPYKALAITKFYNEYQNDDLAINKWFDVLAMAQTTTVTDIQKLLKHKKFTLKNPNKVRSLIGGFTSNLINFHNVAGYTLLGDMIIKLNIINPQIAARLVMNLTNFKCYTDTYKALQQQQLRRILQTENLSVDVLELILHTKEQG